MTNPCDGGSNPFLSAKLLERALLPRLEFINSRFVPVRGLAFRANLGFPVCAFARDPFVLAPVTTIALLLDGDQRHEANIPR